MYTIPSPAEITFSLIFQIQLCFNVDDGQTGVYHWASARTIYRADRTPEVKQVTKYLVCVPDLRHIINYARERGMTALLGAAYTSLSERVFERLFAIHIRRNYRRMIVDSDELTSTTAQVVHPLEDETDGLSSDLNRQIAPLQGCEEVSHTYLPRFTFKQPFVGVVNDTTISGRHAIAVLPDGRILTEPIYSLAETHTDRVAKRVLSSMAKSPLSVGFPIIRGSQPQATRTFDEAAILYTKWKNYYHWMIEQVPKLRGVKKYEEFTDSTVHLIIPSNPPSYVHETLDILGYENRDYTEWDGATTNVKSLVTPSFPEPTPRTLRWLRDTMVESVLCSTDHKERKIVYITRQNTARRRVRNFGEIESVLEKYGVRVVDCEEMTLREEIALFSSAEGIIGPHGAGLAAMVWADRLNVVELFNSVVVPPYYVLAHVLGHDYTALHGIPVDTEAAARDFHRDFKIRVDEFESVVSSMVCSQND